jgi:hypothetical protein
MGISPVSLSSTIRSFSAVVHRRRRSGPGSTVTVIVCSLICKLMSKLSQSELIC